MQQTLRHRQIACVRVSNFPWEVEASRRPSLRDLPVLITSRRLEWQSEPVGNAGDRIVVDSSPGLGGVVYGMPLSGAVSRHKDAVLVEADMPLYTLVFDEVLRAIERVAPDVEDGGLGLAYVGIWGLERLYGDDAQVVRLLAETVSAVSGLSLRIGVGENKWLAYVASMLSNPASGRKVTGEPSRFLSGFPVDLLPVPYGVVQRLRAFGLSRMGEVAALQQGPMEAQFGPVGGTVWRLSNGIDDRSLAPRKLREVVSEYLLFPDVTVSLPAIVSAIESLLVKAFSRPQMARRYAREAELQAQVFRRAPWTVRVAFKESTGSKNRALFAIKAKLNSVKIPGPLEDMRLTLSGLSGESWRQESMWKEVQQEDRLREAVSQLRARLGVAPPIYQVRELEPWSRIPERRHALVQLSP